MEIKAPARLRGVPGRPSSAHAGDGKGGHGNGGHHSGGGGSRGGAGRDRYKWVALTNTTVGVLLVMIDSSIVMIAMPAIFRGIHLNPLQTGNSFYLLWMMLGYLIVTSVLVVSFGRLGDMFGRVKMYNHGFLIFTIASVLLSVDWMTGRAGATYLIVFRVVQGIGGAFIAANSRAILTDAFPVYERGLALGINNVSSIAGRFIGLVLGGLLAVVDWRLVFFVSVPFGIFGTIWSYTKLQERGVRTPAPIDWWGNATFAIGLILVMIGITGGIQPHGGHVMGWTSPKVLTEIGVGVVLLVAFCLVETRVANPMFQMQLFRIRAFTFGTMSSFLSALARGGMMFMLIIWLQGIWLPLHGFSFDRTPLWAGIAMMPLSLGILVAGPASGYLSDRFGSRPFASGGMIAACLSFVFLVVLPVNFNYIVFALILLLSGIGQGAFASPNAAGIMNALPADKRGVGSGMNTTFQNSAQVLSIGVFFSLMISGLANALSSTVATGLRAQGVSAATANHVAHLPPVSVLFAAFLGYNPIERLLGEKTLSQLPHAAVASITARNFFPSLISDPFRSGLHETFAFAAAICLVAALASWSRGAKPVLEEGGV
ncbi:MAG: MFS transporter, partial [Acidimicrobiaceae bacterium]|nr:MFS transporter [Acidimicrobiaceae bacterium]